MNIKAIGQALRNKAGAPGRAYVERKSAYQQKKSDKEVAWLKDYNAKDKQGLTTPKERAQFDMFKSRKY